MMKSFLKVFCLVIVLTMFLFTEIYAQDYSGRFEFDGRNRNYDVYLPQNFKPEMPVVLNLHGFTWTTDDHANNTLMHEFADTSGFIVVYPEGSYFERLSGWNNGLRDASLGVTNTKANDVGFISALIDTLDAHYNIDLSRVYSCGFSMGGEMTYRLAIELGHRFAAIASVAGKLNDVSGNIGDPLRPFPVLHIHGTYDWIENYGQGGGNLWSVEETLNFWIENNNCLLPAETVSLPDLDPYDGCTVKKISYTDCSGNSPIIHFKVIFGGHSWPGSRGNGDINASVEILNFFKNYENPLTNTAYGKKVEVSPKCFLPQGDTLIVSATLSNPENHPVLVQAMIKANRHAFRDTIQLFDDGEHSDGYASDNIWGATKWFSGLEGDNYVINLSTEDITTDITQHLRSASAFTTLGPIKVSDYEITSSDTVPNPGDRLLFDIKLKNEGSTATASDITATMESLDTCAAVFSSDRTFGDIPPGENAEGNRPYTIQFYDVCADSIWVSFKVDIYSDNYWFWTDTFSVFVQDPLGLAKKDETIPMKFDLKQNYPNPFNPTTNINYELPITNYVKLNIYNLVGQKITTLVSEKQKAGYHQVEWDASGFASGIYYYQIKTGEFQDVKKMILLR